MKRLGYLFALMTLSCGADDVRSGGDGSESGVQLESDSGADGGVSGDALLDIGGGQDGGENPDCVDPSGSGTVDYKFSLIWIANSNEGTVSKIDTITATELARYSTGPLDDGGGAGYELNPSRTSVNLVGDVVVGNRGWRDYQSSFTKFHGEAETCADKNGDGVVRTSSGPADVLPWGEDECADWHYTADGYASRAVAWDPGEFDACGFTREPIVWLGFRNADGDPEVHQVDNYGQQLASVVLGPPFQPAGNQYAIYGGASDKDGNFIANGASLAVVDRETLEVRDHSGGNGYGIAVDAQGRSWTSNGVGAVNRVDRSGNEPVFTQFRGAVGGYDRGVVVDDQGALWLVVNDPCGLARFDTEAEVWTDPFIELPGCIEPVGVSVDFEGHVWVVDREAENALKLAPNDPGNGVSIAAEVTGLVKPYTYSDMTGAMLNLVVNPPVG